MSGKCGPTLVAVADAAPDNWTFLERLRPDEQAVDFFHACEHPGEVADRRDRLVRPRHPARRRRRQGYSGTTSATGRRRKRRFLSASSGSSAGTGAACATRASRSEVTRSGVVEAANKVLVNQRMKRARWSVAGGQNVLTFRVLSGRFDAAWRAMAGRRKRQPERRLTAEAYKQNRYVKRETGFLQK